MMKSPHTCHARGCDTFVSPRLLRHWRMVPKAMQREVWAHYRAGQENREVSSTDEWHAAANAAVNAVAAKEAL